MTREQFIIEYAKAFGLVALAFPGAILIFAATWPRVVKFFAACRKWVLK